MERVSTEGKHENDIFARFKQMKIVIVIDLIRAIFYVYFFPGELFFINLKQRKLLKILLIKHLEICLKCSHESRMKAAETKRRKFNLISLLHRVLP